MLIILFNGFAYFIYGSLTYCAFVNLTPFSFTVLFYIAPLIINIIFSNVYIKKSKIMWAKIVSPIFSTINYVLLGFVVQTNGLWAEFVNQYSTETDEVSISVASSMITLSQIAFAILLYFGINYLVVIILMKKRGAK